MNAITRRLDRIDDALWEPVRLLPDQEALIQAVAARRDLDPNDLRSVTMRIARTYQGYTREQIAQELARQEGGTAEELLAEAALIEQEVCGW